jgi:hypothetical protein
MYLFWNGTDLKLLSRFFNILVPRSLKSGFPLLFSQILVNSHNTSLSGTFFIHVSVQSGKNFPIVSNNFNFLIGFVMTSFIPASMHLLRFSAKASAVRAIITGFSGYSLRISSVACTPSHIGIYIGWKCIRKGSYHYVHQNEVVVIVSDCFEG